MKIEESIFTEYETFLHEAITQLQTENARLRHAVEARLDELVGALEDCLEYFIDPILWAQDQPVGHITVSHMQNKLRKVLAKVKGA